MIKRLLVVISVFTATIILAQRNNSSPYSVFEIGEDKTQKTVEQSSMGGIGVAMKQLNYLNFINPAANADLRYATYAIGGEATFLTLKESEVSQSGNSTSLRYIALGFPVSKKAGFSVGLQPLSSVGYTLQSRKMNGEIVEKTTRYTGKGGTNRLYATFGIYLFEGFSVGIEGAFVFGNIKRNILNQNNNQLLSTRYRENLNLRGSEFKVGAQYKTDLSDKLQLSTGIALKLSNTLTKKGTESLYSILNNKEESPVDTLYSNSVNTSVKMPVKTVVGFGLGKENKWYVGINSEFKKPLSILQKSSQNFYKYENAFATSLGGYYIPKINSISSYWDRVTYRAGFHYENTGLMVNGDSSLKSNFTSIKDFGINVGLGLPLPRQISNLNIGIEYGQKGTTNNNLIKENYFNIGLSLSLNSINWFKKRRID